MDEKDASGGLIGGRAHSPRRSSWKILKGALLLSCAVGLYFTHSWRPCAHLNTPAQHGAVRLAVVDEFDWGSMIPSKTLEWVQCYDGFQCTRFEVPLDYAKPRGPKAALALIRYPSKYPVGHDKWRGPILYNPGGPGGSGVERLQARAASFSRIIGDDFDYVSFDPRGIGRTTPTLDVFSGEAERKLWDTAQPPPINVTADALARQAGYARILGDLAAERGEVAATHMSTAMAARDMLQITKAYGRDKLLYWGFSYGTVLGITYASMFPDNIDRLIVDGVADTYNYYAGAWSNNLIDTDRALEIRPRCPCAIDKIMESLKTRPLVAHNGSLYRLADYAMARLVAFQALYKPADTYPPLMEALLAAERGDGAPLFALSQRKDSLWRCSCGGPSGQSDLAQAWLAAVACGDADPVDGDLDQLERDYKEMAAVSEWANLWSPHWLCSGWKLRPVERFSGPFGGNTSFPLLLIGNTADPVTPLWAAKKMSKGFKDAVVLTQNNAGHCSTSSASLCTAKHVRAYFREGKLPEPGTVCEVETNIFEPDDKRLRKGTEVNALSAEDAELLSAARDLAAGFDVPMFGALF